MSLIQRIYDKPPDGWEQVTRAELNRRIRAVSESGDFMKALGGVLIGNEMQMAFQEAGGHIIYIYDDIARPEDMKAAVDEVETKAPVRFGKGRYEKPPSQSAPEEDRPAYIQPTKIYETYMADPSRKGAADRTAKKLRLGVDTVKKIVDTIQGELMYEDYKAGTDRMSIARKYGRSTRKATELIETEARRKGMRIRTGKGRTPCSRRIVSEGAVK